MKPFYYTFICLILLSQIQFASAQTECWGWMLGSPGFEKNDAMAIDDDGNIWLAGSFDTMVDFDPDTSTHFLVSQLAPGYFIASYDIDGALRFAFPMPGLQAFDMETDTSGNVFITGYHLTPFDADPGPGTFLLPVFGSTDICIISYDKNGNFRWAHGIGSAAGDVGSSLSIEHSGNIILGGTFSLSVDWGGDTTVSVGGEDAFVASFSNSGNFNWATSFGSSDFENGVRVKAAIKESKIWAAASFRDTIVVPNDTSTTTHISKGEEDIVLVQFDASGNMISSFQFGGKDRDLIQELAVDSSDMVFLAGTFKDTLPTDSSLSPSHLISKGDADVFVISYTPTGLFNAAHSIGGPDFDEVTGLDLSLKGSAKRKLFLGGNFSTSVELGINNSQQTVSLTSSDFKDSYLAWFDLDNFTLNGFEQIGDSGATVGLNFNVIPEKDTDNKKANIIVTGRSSGKVHLPPYPGQILCSNAIPYITQGGFDLFGRKLPVLVDSTTSIENQNLPFTVQLFPNPAKDFLEIQVDDDIGSGTSASIEVYNIEGKNLISQQISLDSNYRVSVKDFSRGVYFLRIVDSKGRGYSLKFIKE